MSTRNDGPGVRRLLFPVDRLLVGEEAGVEAGAEAGAEAGEEAGEEAGAEAGAEAGGSGQNGGLDAEHVADLQVIHKL